MLQNLQDSFGDCIFHLFDYRATAVTLDSLLNIGETIFDVHGRFVEFVFIRRKNGGSTDDLYFNAYIC